MNLKHINFSQSKFLSVTLVTLWTEQNNISHLCFSLNSQCIYLQAQQANHKHNVHSVHTILLHHAMQHHNTHYNNMILANSAWSYINISIKPCVNDIYELYERCSIYFRCSESQVESSLWYTIAVSSCSRYFRGMLLAALLYSQVQTFPCCITLTVIHQLWWLHHDQQ